MLTPLNLELEDADPQAHFRHSTAGLMLTTASESLQEPAHQTSSPVDSLHALRATELDDFPSNIKILQFYETKQQLLAKAPQVLTGSWKGDQPFPAHFILSPLSLTCSSFTDISSVIPTPGPQTGTPTPKSSHGCLPIPLRSVPMSPPQRAQRSHTLLPTLSTTYPSR